jgi:hypothetical protein
VRGKPLAAEMFFGDEDFSAETRVAALTYIAVAGLMSQIRGGLETTGCEAHKGYGKQSFQRFPCCSHEQTKICGG